MVAERLWPADRKRSRQYRLHLRITTVCRSAGKRRIGHSFIDSVREDRTAIASSTIESLLDSDMPETLNARDTRREHAGLRDYSLAGLHNLHQPFPAAEAHVGKAQRATNE